MIFLTLPWVSTPAGASYIILWSCAPESRGHSSRCLQSQPSPCKPCTLCWVWATSSASSSLLYTPKGGLCIFYYLPYYWWGFPVAQTVKNLPAMQETWGWKDPLEKGMATHSSILAWRIPWTEDPGGLQSMGSERFGHDWASITFTFHTINRKASLFLPHFPNLQLRVQAPEF